MVEQVGVDTTFLVQAEVRESQGHAEARAYLENVVAAGKAQLAVAPQILVEFLHVVTDPRRFERPLEMAEAAARADFWWRAREVVQVFPSAASTEIFLDWMRLHRLGHKRLLDTQLAAIFAAAGIEKVLSATARGFEIFGCFKPALG